MGGHQIRGWESVKKWGSGWEGIKSSEGLEGFRGRESGAPARDVGGQRGSDYSQGRILTSELSPRDSGLWPSHSQAEKVHIAPFIHCHR